MISTMLPYTQDQIGLDLKTLDQQNLSNALADDDAKPSPVTFHWKGVTPAIYEMLTQWSLQPENWERFKVSCLSVVILHQHNLVLVFKSDVSTAPPSRRRVVRDCPRGEPRCRNNIRTNVNLPNSGSRSCMVDEVHKTRQRRQR